MKTKLFALALMLCTAISFTASAQTPTYAPQTVLSSYVVSIGSTSNSIGSVIDCRKQQNLALQWQIASPTFLQTTNGVMRLSASVDGLVYATNKFVLTANSTTAPLNVLSTNLSVGGYGYLRVDSITSDGIALTNNLKYGIKISSP